MSLKSARRVLEVEALENRVVPACTRFIFGTELVINGTDEEDTIHIRDSGVATGGNLQVTCDGQTLILPATTFTTIRVNTFDDDDVVTYQQTGKMASTRNIFVNLGEDEDTFRADLHRAARANVAFNLEVVGGDDDDAIVVDATAMRLQGGASLNVDIWGDDRNGGGEGDDEIQVFYSALALGNVHVDVFGGDGEDEITAVLSANETATNFSTGLIEANIFGQDEDDDLTLILRRSTNSTSLLDGFIDGGEGDNDCTRTANVIAINCEEDHIVA